MEEPVFGQDSHYYLKFLIDHDTGALYNVHLSRWEFPGQPFCIALHNVHSGAFLFTTYFFLHKDKGPYHEAGALYSAHA